MKEIVYFLKIDGIQGESTDEKHKDEIEVQSWSWGVSQTGTSASSGGTTGKVEIQSMHIVAAASKASPRLMLACASGQHSKEATLTAARRKKKGKLQDLVTFKLSDVLVASYHIGAEQGVQPVDAFDLSFTKIEMQYIPTKEDGSPDAPVKAGWDVKTNKPI